MKRGINSEGSAERKALFEQMVKDAGYETIHQFSKDVNIDMANLYSNLDGTWKMSLRRMFKVANALAVPIGQVIAIFYPEEYEENMKLL